MLQVVTFTRSCSFFKNHQHGSGHLEKKRNPGAMSYEQMLKKKQCIVTIKNIAKVKRVQIPYKPDKSRKSCVYNCDDLLPYTICFISLLKLHIADDQVRAFVAVYLEGHLVELDAVSKTN